MKKREAVRFALGQAPTFNDVTTWILMLDACQKLEDADVGGQVLKWILASQAKFGGEQAKANELGDRLAKLGWSMRR